MSEISDRYATIADGFAARLEGAAPEAWSRQSPCEEWTARDVASHVVHVHRRVLGTLSGSDAPEPAAGEDLVKAFRSETAAVRAALADPDQVAKTVSSFLGEQPFEQLVGRLLCADTLIHTWDFARATGQDDTLDPKAVRAAQGFLIPIDEGIRRPGGFAPKIEPPAGADEQTAFLAFAGRKA